MIKVTALDGTEIFLNPDLIERITVTPDTHLKLTNGNNIIVLEPAKVIVGRIISFKTQIMRRSITPTKRYLQRNSADKYIPNCEL